MKRIIKTASALCQGTFLIALAFVIAGVLLMAITAPNNPDEWADSDRALHAQISLAFIVAALSGAFTLLMERTGSKQP